MISDFKNACIFLPNTVIFCGFIVPHFIPPCKRAAYAKFFRMSLRMRAIIRFSRREI